MTEHKLLEEDQDWPPHTFFISFNQTHKTRTFLTLGHFFCQLKCECLFIVLDTELVLSAEGQSSDGDQAE